MKLEAKNLYGKNCIGGELCLRSRCVTIELGEEDIDLEDIFGEFVSVEKEAL